MVAKFDWLRGVTNQMTEGGHISHSLLKNADILEDKLNYLTASREISRMFYALPNIYKVTDFNEMRILLLDKLRQPFRRRPHRSQFRSSTHNFRPWLSQSYS